MVETGYRLASRYEVRRTILILTLASFLTVTPLIAVTLGGWSTIIGGLTLLLMCCFGIFASRLHANETST